MSEQQNGGESDKSAIEESLDPFVLARAERERMKTKFEQKFKGTVDILDPNNLLTVTNRDGDSRRLYYNYDTNTHAFACVSLGIIGRSPLNNILLTNVLEGRALKNDYADGDLEETLFMSFGRLDMFESKDSFNPTIKEISLFFRRYGGFGIWFGNSDRSLDISYDDTTKEVKHEINTLPTNSIDKFFQEYDVSSHYDTKKRLIIIEVANEGNVLNRISFPTRFDGDDIRK